MSVLYRMLEPGANLHPSECILVYIISGWFWIVSGEWGAAMQELASWNAVCQLSLFVVAVQIPTFVTGHMSYVDLGWPCGLCVLAVNVLTSEVSVGHDLRRSLVGYALLVHGARMFLGALVLYFPYIWEEDLSRYQFARTRWNEHTGSPELWWLKQQHDTLMQCFANCFTFAVPILLVATNPRPTLHALEVCGLGCWAVFWCLENAADLQMLVFLREARKAGDARTAVLGHASYAKPKYCLWTRCRHPNYFFEWACWCSFVLAAAPSALDLVSDPAQGAAAKMGAVVTLFLTVRLFYDCLVHWTGAAPAESRSVRRRPAFKRYQENTRVLFPFPVPFWNHHQTPGWPLGGNAAKRT